MGIKEQLGKAGHYLKDLADPHLRRQRAEVRNANRRFYGVFDHAGRYGNGKWFLTYEDISTILNAQTEGPAQNGASNLYANERLKEAAANLSTTENSCVAFAYFAKLMDGFRKQLDPLPRSFNTQTMLLLRIQKCKEAETILIQQICPNSVQNINR